MAGTYDFDRSTSFGQGDEPINTLAQTAAFANSNVIVGVARNSLNSLPNSMSKSNRELGVT